MKPRLYSPSAITVGSGGEFAGETPVGLRQRLWPVIDLFERALAAREPVVWGA